MDIIQAICFLVRAFFVCRLSLADEEKLSELTQFHNYFDAHDT
jgi:hypothetical protein